MRQALLFLPRLACAVTCVGIILTAAPILALLSFIGGELAGDEDDHDEQDE